METHPFLNTAKVMNCIEQIIAGDIFLLFLNPVFSMALVAIFPCISIIWGSLSANNKLSLHSVVESILMRAKMYAYPLLCPIYYSSLTLPIILLGWFHLIVGSSKLMEVLGTSPAFFPWITYATRNHSHLPLNYVEVGHSPWMNQIWVTYEPSKHIVLQWVDFCVYHYVLVCSVVVFFIAILTVVEGVLFLVIYGQQTRTIMNYEFNGLHSGPFKALFFYVYKEELKDIEKGYEDESEQTITPFESFLLLVARILFVIDDYILAPGRLFMVFLPVLSMTYGIEELLLQMGSPLDAHNLGLNSSELVTLLEMGQHTLHASAWYMYPVHKLVFAHMECVHAFWSFIGMM